MKLTLGFSPCPNDTFIFDAMIHGRIDTEGLEFDFFLSDVEELNRKAFASEVDITKISYHAYAYAARDYRILDSGSALGHKNGPLLVARKKTGRKKLESSRIAIPGKHTTANLLLGIAVPGALDKTEFLFSDIADAVIEDKADVGLIIHETRFTYPEKGLVKILDLGEYWEKLTRLPIPLGAIVINRRIPFDIALKVNRIIRKSIEFAYDNSDLSFDFVQSHAREMDSSVMNSHIKLFVNNYSVDLGRKGREAVRELFRIASLKGIIPEVPEDIFLT